MLKQDMLRPVDLAVVVALAVKPAEPSPTYDQLGQALGLSSSTSYQSVQRLQSAGLLRPETRKPNRTVLMHFLQYGARCAFPPAIGKEVRGVPTAHSGPALSAFFHSAKPYVWPNLDGTVRGTGMAPLYPKAAALVSREPEIYDALTLVDALRVGEARERNLALEALRKRLGAAK